MFVGAIHESFCDHRYYGARPHDAFGKGTVPSGAPALAFFRIPRRSVAIRAFNQTALDTLGPISPQV